MALQPEDRYASPRALAEDVERWLADEPVGPYREPARPPGPLGPAAPHRAWPPPAHSSYSLALAATAAILYDAHDARRKTTRACRRDDGPGVPSIAPPPRRTPPSPPRILATEAEAEAREQMSTVFGKVSKTVEDLVELVRDDQPLRETPALRPFRGPAETLPGLLAGLRPGVRGRPPTSASRWPTPIIRSAISPEKWAARSMPSRRPISRHWQPAALVAEQPEIDAYRDRLAWTCNNLGRVQNRPAGHRGGGGAELPAGAQLHERLAAAAARGRRLPRRADADLHPTRQPAAQKAAGRAAEAERVALLLWAIELSERRPTRSTCPATG